VSRLGSIEPALTRDVEDWEVLLALNRRGDVDGFITNDSGMLLLPTEMVALSKTGLSLVITEEVGHNSVRATGLIRANLETIAGRVNQTPQIFRLKPSQMQSEHPKTLVTKYADRARIPVGDVIAAELNRMGLA
jgi:hypothetical protein